MTKRTSFTLAFICILVETHFAQTLSLEYGKVGKDDIELQSYTADKSAEAVVLFDYGKSYFIDTDGGFDVAFERTTRIKIFSDAGLKWAEIEVPFYQEGYIYEKVENVEATTYNFEDGRLNITKLDPSQSQVEKINEDWSLKKFALPNVKPGSIIEYKYRVTSQYLFNLRDWEFQWKIPVVYSEYEVRMIPFYQYTWLLQGASKFDAQSSDASKGLDRNFQSIKYKEMVHKYIMKNLPAFKDETYITSINDYITKIDFQLSKINYPNGTTREIQTTWEKMVDDLLKNESFGKYVKKSQKNASLILDPDSMLNKGNKEKFDYVLNSVKMKFTWNKRNSKYASGKVNEFFKNKVGNSADINLFTIGLLNSCGIEAYPVIISTRENGKIKIDYPFSHFFNYVLIMAKIDGKTYLTDATEILNSTERLPERCINDKGLVIKEGDIEWVGLGCNYVTSLQTIIEIKQFDTLNLNHVADLYTSANEYSALYMRNKYGEDTKKLKEKINEDEGISLVDSTLKVENPMNYKKPYNLKYSLIANYEKINNKIYCSPFLKEVMDDNPLKQNSRSYPIDMSYPEKRTYSSTIIIPPSYKIDYLPANSKISNDKINVEYSVMLDEGKIIISFGYFFKKSVYPATDYMILKASFDEIVKKGNEKIVFVKQ